MALQEASDKKKLPADLVFPVMAKTLQASGSHAAHDMAVCWSLDDIDKYAYPLYVQEYVNHGGTIFKIYVLGPDHFVVTRVSLPDFPKTYQKPVEFNSQDWKHELPPELTKEYTGKRKEPSHDILTRVSKCVSDLLHLTLFGFDVIENVDTGRLAVIDVNYFPGTWIWRLQLDYEEKCSLQAPTPTAGTLSQSNSFLSPSTTQSSGEPFGSPPSQPGTDKSSVPRKKKSRVTGLGAHTLRPSAPTRFNFFSNRVVPLFADYRGVSDVFGKLLTHLTNMYEANAPLQH